MDPFDDILPVAPARARAGAKFMPKAKPKHLPPKQAPSSEHAIATSSREDGNNDPLNAQGISDARASILTTSAAQHATNSEIINPQQASRNTDTAVPEVDAHWNFTNFPKSASEADSVGFEVSPVANFIPQTSHNNGATQPVQPANAVENILSNVAAPSTTYSTIGTMEEPPKEGDGLFLDSNKHLEPIDDSLQVSLDLGFKSTPDSKVESAEFELDPFIDVLPDPGAKNARKFQPKIKPQPRVGTSQAIASASSDVMTEKSDELPTSCINEVQAFQSSVDASGGLNQSTNLTLSTSEILSSTDLSNKFDYMSSNIPLSEDNRSSAPAIPSLLDSPNALLPEVVDHNETRDWPSSFGKSAGETADIFSGLESFDDFLTQAGTDPGKPALRSFNEKSTEESSSFGVCDTTQVQKCPKYPTTQDSLTFNEATVLNEDCTHTNSRRSETEEVVDLNPASPVDNVFNYESMKSVADPASETQVHEELTNAADSPTLADLFHADVTGEKEDASERKKDSTMSSDQFKHRRSSIDQKEDKVGKTSRQLRKQAARKPANNMVNEDVEDDDDLDPPYNPIGDELEENDDEFEVDNSSKKQRASTNSKKKSVAKNEKTSQKRKRVNENSEKTTKQPKKFSHSTRRRKRCVDKALLEIPEDELDLQTLPIKDIILLAEYKERLAKKEASTMKTSATNQSDGDFLHEAGANNEEEILGSEDDRDPDDDQASERIPVAASLFNYQSFMEKAPRGKWSKQDTELFYEAVRQFGTDFSMIQQLFPDRTRHQIKLKYKKEERQHPLQLSDAVNNRAKDHSHFKLVIERLQQASTKAEQDPTSRDASDFMTGEEVEDLTPGTPGANDEVATTEQETSVKDQEDSAAFNSPEHSNDDDDDDFQIWSQYKSDY